MRAFISAAIALFAALAAGTAQAAEARPDAMRIHVMDVGQGSATLVEFPCAAVLIDTGGEKSDLEGGYDSGVALKAYLDAFFQRRADLNRTFSLLAITHAHIDHTLNIPLVIENYHVRNVVTNGDTVGSGGAQQKWLQDWIKIHTGQPAVEFEAATLPRIRRKDGLTSPVIDPVSCQPTDPRIRVLWGGVANNEGIYSNQNNQSVVLRIDYGASSLLVTGDLEDEVMEQLLAKTKDTDALDTDVYIVGHHGSHNGTTEEFLKRVTPKIAVMSMGPRSREEPWTAWAYGHPRKVLVDLLNRNVSNMAPQRDVPDATGVKKFETSRITKEIYGTGWDRNIVVEAGSDGKLKVLTNQ